jgi:lipopolysaccharide export system permease protein
MKILSRYILKEHIAPFLFAFVTVTFLLILDFVPRIINLVMEKDVSVLVVLELIGLNLAWMLALSVPMSVLVATLIAFGRMTADLEITAVKASGINMLRLLLPVIAAGAAVTWGMIEFNDRILPDLNKKARHLRSDISGMRPTLMFESGIFISDIPGYLVMIDDIDHTTSRVEGVSITELRTADKPRIIVAKDGYMKMTDNGRNMQFDLYDGEIHELDLNQPDEYKKIDFKNQVINVSDVGSELVRTDSDHRTDREMNIKDMKARVNRALSAVEPYRRRINDKLSQKIDYLFSETFEYSGLDSVTDSTAFAHLKNDASVLKRHVEKNRQQILAQKRQWNKFSIEIYKKYSIPAASLAFVLIGAPLAILSRKGGMGVAIAVSIGLFVVYWAFLIAGEDLADRDMAPPFWAMWSANMLLASVGLYLLYIVVSERRVFGFLRGRRKRKS